LKYNGIYTGLFKIIVGVLTTCRKQYTWVRRICIFLFNRTTLQVFVTYLTGALYVHPLWFYKHQRENRVRSKLFVACQRFAAILVNCAPSGEMRNYCTPHIIKENSENFLIHLCNYTLPSQVYCVWQVVKTPTIILNNPVLYYSSPGLYALISLFNAGTFDIYSCWVKNWWSIFNILNTEIHLKCT